MQPFHLMILVTPHLAGQMETLTFTPVALVVVLSALVELPSVADPAKL